MQMISGRRRFKQFCEFFRCFAYSHGDGSRILQKVNSLLVKLFYVEKMT